MLSELVGRISLAPHPTRRDFHGVKVEAFPLMRQVKVNGERVAYCGTTSAYALTFIRWYPQELVDSVAQYVRETCGPYKCVSLPPREIVDDTEDVELVEDAE